MNLKTLVGALAAACIFWTPTTALADSAAAAAPHSYTRQAADDGPMHLFQTEDSARQHCPNDQIVWLNTHSGIYHEKGMRWYGNTKSGAYVCRKEADQDGDRDTRNGQ